MPCVMVLKVETEEMRLEFRANNAGKMRKWGFKQAKKIEEGIDE